MPVEKPPAVDLVALDEPVGTDHPGQPDVDHLPLVRDVDRVEGDQRDDPGDQQRRAAPPAAAGLALSTGLKPAISMRTKT